MVYAHSLESKSQSDWETLETHALRVAQAVRVRAEPFGGGEYTRALRMLHDLGKMKPAFQRKLAGERNDAGHSGEGARVLYERGGFPAALAGISGVGDRLSAVDGVGSVTLQTVLHER